MSSEAQKRKARHNFVNNGCDKKTDKCKYIAWFGKKMRYETGKRLIRKLLLQEYQDEAVYSGEDSINNYGVVNAQ